MKKKPVLVAAFKIPKTKKARILVAASMFARGVAPNQRNLDDLHTSLCIAEQLIAEARGLA